MRAKDVQQRREGTGNVPSPKPFYNLLQQRSRPLNPKLSVITSHATKTASQEPKHGETKYVIPARSGEARDPDVSDQVWRQLQADKRAAVLEAGRRETNLQQLENQLHGAKELAQQAQMNLRKKQAQKGQALNNELKRRHEEERLKLLCGERGAREDCCGAQGEAQEGA